MSAVAVQKISLGENDLTAFENHLRQTCGSKVGKDSTVSVYSREVQRFLKWLDGQPLNIDTLEAYLQSHADLNPQTVNKIAAALRRYMGWLARRGDDDATRALVIMQSYKITPPIRDKDRKIREPMSREQFEAALTYLDKHASYGLKRERDQAFLSVLWGAGVRRSEALSLTRGQAKELATAGLTSILGKRGRRRTIALGSKHRSRLAEWLKVQGGCDDGLAFPFSSARVDRMFETIGLVNGKIRSSPHTFRHAFRQRARQEKIDYDLTRAMLGHGPLDTTSAYGQKFEPAELLDAAEKLA